eukprot:scaffold164349_cov17-Tisochrysis_lutea.AAC.1
MAKLSTQHCNRKGGVSRAGWKKAHQSGLRAKSTTQDFAGEKSWNRGRILPGIVCLMDNQKAHALARLTHLVGQGDEHALGERACRRKGGYHLREQGGTASGYNRMLAHHSNITAQQCNERAKCAHNRRQHSSPNREWWWAVESSGQVHTFCRVGNPGATHSHRASWPLGRLSPQHHTWGQQRKPYLKMLCGQCEG